MKSHRTHSSIAAPVLVLASLVLAACFVDTAPEGLRRTPDGPGARVVYDTSRRPIPEIPLPNDTATFADPTSRTGRRVNVSLFAPTQMERVARQGLGELEGWGIYAPLWVSFQRSSLSPDTAAALSLEEVQRRMPRSDFEFSDDPFYVVNLKTGVPVILDMGTGALRMTLRDPSLYWANDTHAKESNLLFETREEGAGIPQSQYIPELDTDFDGVIDHPNTLGTGGKHGYDNLLTWYERETDTLILRPRIPLEEGAEYAVVLTDRLIGQDGRPVLSPFSFIHHAQQRNEAGRVRDILSDASRRNYYGDIAGTGLDHVAFVWTFTTQPVQEDMRILRDGLYGVGPFARFEREFPAQIAASPAAGVTGGGEPQPDGWQANPKCTAVAKKPFVFDLGDPQVLKEFGGLLASVTGGTDREKAALLDSFSNISHVIIGDFEAPYLIGDPKKEGPDDHFHVDFKSGEGSVGRDKVHFWMVVPKETAQHKQPFPISIVGHGYGGQAENVMSFGGETARQGIAAITIDMPHHGIALKPSEDVLVKSALSGLCYAPLADAILSGRATDANGDGQRESGWWWWTSHLFHVRDNVRQGIVESMQLSRILAGFDGVKLADQDYDGDGRSNLAGDFDGNGVPDVGAPITATGGSLGGIITQILGGVDHQLVATAPIVGGGGLTDIGLRSYGVAESVLQQTLTPLVVAIPSAERPEKKGVKQTTCGPAERSVRFILNDGRDSVEVEIACLPPGELEPGMTVIVTNVATREARCGGTWQDGRFRVPIPASVDDRLDVQIYNRAHAVTSYGTCELVADAPVGRRISTFERAAPFFRPTAMETTCEAEEGCTQFLDRFYTVGSPLVAPQDGLGMRRQTPLFRRFFALGQMVLDGADPIAFAPYHALKPVVRPDGSLRPPMPVLNAPSVGDNFVATSSEIAFGRAAGIVPFLPPEMADRYPEYRDYVTPRALYAELGGRTPDQVLIDGYVTEGIAHLERTPAGPSCKPNLIDAPDCQKKTDPSMCRTALFDADWLDEGAMPFDQQHPVVPLRLARRADLLATDPSAVDRVWEPRLVGKPLGPGGWTPGAPLLAQLHIYSNPQGTHAVSGGPCTLWDPEKYLIGTVTRFLATRGQDVLAVTRPSDHRCLANASCDFQKP